MKLSKIKQTAIAGFAALALLSGCAKSDFEKRKDLEKIVLSESPKNQVVMFGESHNEYRRDNDFVIGLLPGLKKQGFEYFAVELTGKQSGSNMAQLSKIFKDYLLGLTTKEDITEEKYLFSLEELEVYTTGWLDLLAKAKETGMKIVFYDADHYEYSSFNHRDEIAFKNLREIIFDKDPGAKVVIYCGRRHINEKEAYDKDVAKWEEESGLDKLDKDKKFKSVAYHLNLYTQGKLLTVSLKGSDKYVKYCDIDLDLDNNKCLRNKPKDYGGK
ncbi:hypothetical protein FJZ53_04570 [Candidatus Woesearchaeota archaeon]|nr:hypothetical protein [Candidatus Woesearchaeota archaeon]